MLRILAPMCANDEALAERFWRERCGEPAPGRWPVRCRRDLSHPDGHLGDDLIEWSGVGNAITAQRGPGFRCWCTLHREAGEIRCPRCRRWLKPNRWGSLPTHYAVKDGLRKPWPGYCLGARP